jgi:uncharacterized protein (TIGR00251 family)
LKQAARIKKTKTAMILQLKVVPKASRNRVVGWVGERLKIQVTAAPERGKANDAVIEVLAAALGLPRSQVRLVAGETSPLKTVEIGGDDSCLLNLPKRI